jgi:hypothetical protein
MLTQQGAVTKLLGEWQPRHPHHHHLSWGLLYDAVCVSGTQRRMVGLQMNGALQKTARKRSWLSRGIIQTFSGVPQLKRLVSGFPPWRLVVESGHTRCVEDKVALERVFSSTSVSPANSRSTNCSTFINHPIMRR